MNNKNLYQQLKKYKKPSNLIKGFFSLNLDKKLSEFTALDLGAGVRK